MARIDAHEIEDITAMLATLGTKWEGTAKQGLYEGAKVLKEELDKEIDNLPYSRTHYYPKAALPLHAIREIEKKALKDGLRIFKMERAKDGVSVTIGFVGYTDYHGKKIPNALVARSLTKGTSVQSRNNFVNRAYRRAKDRRTQAMTEKIYTVIGKFAENYKKK